MVCKKVVNYHAFHGVKAAIMPDREAGKTEKL
mgnify:CR=1 FL=1